MQANCPQCGNTVSVDDARAPDKPFGVKCPKCQTVVRFPGREAAAAPPSPPAPAPMPPPPPPPSHRPAEASPAGRALVALPDRALAQATVAMLARVGYAAEAPDDWEEGGRILDQGVYALVATARQGGSGGKESLYQRMNRLTPEARRTIFLLLVGDEFKSGDGSQAFVTLADLVLTSRDVPVADALVLAAAAERQRLYQGFHDARRRIDAVL